MCLTAVILKRNSNKAGSVRDLQSVSRGHKWRYLQGVLPQEKSEAEATALGKGQHNAQQRTFLRKLSLVKARV